MSKKDVDNRQSTPQQTSHQEIVEIFELQNHNTTEDLKLPPLVHVKKGHLDFVRNLNKQIVFDILKVKKDLTRNDIKEMLKGNIPDSFKSLTGITQLILDDLEDVTDYSIYQMCKTFSQNNKLLVSRVSLNGCKCVTIWALHFLAQLMHKKLWNLFNPNETTSQSVKRGFYSIYFILLYI